MRCGRADVNVEDVGVDEEVNEGAILIDGYLYWSTVRVGEIRV